MSERPSRLRDRLRAQGTTPDDLSDDTDTDAEEQADVETDPETGNPIADPATTPSAPVVALSEDPADRPPANVPGTPPNDAERQARRGTPQEHSDHERLSSVAQAFNPTRDEVNQGMQPLVDGDDSDLMPALTWALYLLMHPAEQTEFCDIHGRVPVTHMCAGHQNPHYAALLRTVVGTPEEVEARQAEQDDQNA
jgi:hypothetical protein